MAILGLSILGNNSALPAFGRHPTAQILYMDDQTFLIDCGEGTQMQFSLYKIKRSRISHIFISHLHGDHYFGLIGLISSMGLLGREHELNIYGPAELKNIIEMQLSAAGTVLKYPLIFHANEKEGLIIDQEKFSVECFSVKHRIECWGYIFREKKAPRKIDKDNAIKYEIPGAFYKRLQWGEDYNSKTGELIKNEWVTVPNKPGKSYAYCADTIYDESLACKVKQVDLLYHEATYLHAASENATLRFHSTALQAGMLAKAAEAKQLLIGHFSSKYEFVEEFLAEAQTVFPNSSLALEGITFLF